MRIDMSMSRDESKFSVNSWWAGSPEFALHALSSQLKAAAVIFPELAGFAITAPEQPKPDDPNVAPQSESQP